MMTILTDEEELDKRLASFEKLEAGNLFSLGGERCFILVQKGTAKMVDYIPCVVIELTPENRQRIIEGQKTKATSLSFREMSCLHIWNPPSHDSVKLDAELQAFAAMKKDLVLKFPGMFVAIHKGQVIDSDMDQFQLAARIDDLAQREGAIAICWVPENVGTSNG